MKNIKKIDIHAHVTPFPEYAPGLASGIRMASAEEVIGLYDEINIEKGVLLPLASSEYHYETITSGDCKYVSDKYPGRFLWFCGIDPRAAGNSTTTDLSVLIEHYKSLGAKGVGEQTAQFPMDDPYMDNLFYHCGECDMPVTIHLAPAIGGFYGMYDELGLPRLEKMLKKHKKLKILGHSAMFWSHISATVTQQTMNEYPTGKVTDGRIANIMRECENLYCDLSACSGMNAMMRDPDYAARFIEEFSDRLLYGCDICSPYARFQVTFDNFLTDMRRDGAISEENYYKLVRGNAIKLLKLEDE